MDIAFFFLKSLFILMLLLSHGRLDVVVVIWAFICHKLQRLLLLKAKYSCIKTILLKFGMKLCSKTRTNLIIVQTWITHKFYWKKTLVSNISIINRINRIPVKRINKSNGFKYCLFFLYTSKMNIYNRITWNCWKKNLIYIYITYSPLIFLIELWMRKIGVGLNKV